MEAIERIEGPWITVAALCEKVIEHKEGQLSLIGLIDRITVAATGPTIPQKMPPLSVSLMAVVRLASGFARGSYAVGLQLVSPSGMRGPILTSQVLLEGDDRGANLLTQMQATLTEEGLYWFEVFGENSLKTKIPLRVVYQSVSMGQPPTREIGQ